MDLKTLRLLPLIEKSVAEVLVTEQAQERRFPTVQLLGQSQGRSQLLVTKIETDGGARREKKVIEKMVTGLLEGLEEKGKDGNEGGEREIPPTRSTETLLYIMPSLYDHSNYTYDPSLPIDTSSFSYLYSLLLSFFSPFSPVLALYLSPFSLKWFFTLAFNANQSLYIAYCT